MKIIRRLIIPFSLLFIAYIHAFCLDSDCNIAKKESDQSIQNRKNAIEIYGQLSVNGTQLVGESGEPVILRGVSFGWHNWWSGYYNANAVRQLTDDWNSTVVRAAIGVEPDNAYLQNPELAMNCVTAVVDAAIEKGVYVILDWHSHSIQLEPARTFFRTIAEQYKEYPNIIYELYNEPVNDSWQQVKAYSEELIKTIRAIDKKNVILVGSPHWSQDVHLAADDPITGYDNLMYTLHFYAGTHKKWLRDRADYAVSKGLPLFVSECGGMDASGNTNLDVKEWDRWVQWMEDNKMSWVAWSVSGKDETCSMLKTTTDPSSNWTMDDIKPWGIIVRDNLIEMNK